MSHDRIGGASVLLAGVLLWSLGTLVAPTAAQFSLLALCATRAFVRPPFACVKQLSKNTPEDFYSTLAPGDSCIWRRWAWERGLRQLQPPTSWPGSFRVRLAIA